MFLQRSTTMYCQMDEYHQQEISRRIHQMQLNVCLHEMQHIRGTIRVLAADNKKNTLTHIRRKNGAVYYQLTANSKTVKLWIYNKWVCFERSLTPVEEVVFRVLWMQTNQSPLTVHPCSGTPLRSSTL